MFYGRESWITHMYVAQLAFITPVSCESSTCTVTGKRAVSKVRTFSRVDKQKVSIKDHFLRFTFSSATKSQFHDNLVQGVIWANLKHNEAQFLNFSFLQIRGAFSCVFQLVFFLLENLSHFST